MFTKIINFLKRPRNYILTGAAVLILLFVIFGRGNSSKPFETATASVANVQQEVSVTGRIKSSENVDLVFEMPGKIAWIPVKVGQRIYVGQTLMSLDTAELNAQLQSNQANLKSAQAKYDQLISGARNEDIAVYQTNLENAKENLINSLRTTLDTAKNSMITLTDVQYAFKFFNGFADSMKIKDAKEVVLNKIYGQSDLGGIATFYFSQLSDVITPKINKAEASGDYNEILAVSEGIKGILLESRDVLNITYDLMENSPEKTSIGTARSNVLNQISALTSAQGSFNSAQEQLNLKKAPPTEYDLQISQSQLDQAKAGLASVQAQIAKRILRAPISGIVANVNGSVGEISNSSRPAVSLISDSKYEIDVNIPEADIAKTKVGNEANITVDAYGSDVSWAAKVVEIYPAEQIIEGVATYKTVLQFDKADERIRSGMTANIDIIGEKKNGVLAIPQRAVIRKNGMKFVKVMVEKKDIGAGSQFANLNSIFQDKKIAVYEVPVETGIRGNDGKIEITSGLKEGEKIITN